MRLPPGTDVRIGMVPGETDCFVFLAPPPLTAGPHLIAWAVRRGTGRLSVVLTHDAGTDWTDRAGVLMAESVLDRGGPVIMQFATLTDALGAHRRLMRARAGA